MPFNDVLKWLPIGDIEYENATNRAKWKVNNNKSIPSIIGSSDGPKWLLASSVPNLKFNLLIFDGHISWTKFNTYRGIMLIPKFLISELKE